MKLKVVGILMLLSFCSFSKGQLKSNPPTYVGIPSNAFNFFASSQYQNEWCWAASIQMVLNYYDVAINQAEIVQRTYGVDANGQIVNQGASPQVITANLNNWNIDDRGRQYLVQAIYIPGAPTPRDLISQLNQGKPVIIAYRNSQTAGHVIVLTACSYYPTVNGPSIQTLVFRDPWPSSQNVANDGRAEYDANFVFGITGCWFVSVQ